MRYDPSTMLMQTVDRHNKKIEELMKRVNALEMLVMTVKVDSAQSAFESVDKLRKIENAINEAHGLKRGPGRPRKDAQ